MSKRLLTVAAALAVTTAAAAVAHRAPGVSARAAAPAQGKNCTPYEYPLFSAYNVQVKYCQVSSGPNDWTWTFKNTSKRTIKGMDFKVTTYSNYGSDERNDTLPGKLDPGEAIGGWLAFTATSKRRPLISITKIEFED